MKAQKQKALTTWRKRCESGEEKCAKCGLTKHLTVDHIVPLFLLEQFGLDRLEVGNEWEDNFQILCRYCNHEKSARLDVRNPKTFEILEKCIKQVKDDLRT